LSLHAPRRRLMLLDRRREPTFGLNGLQLRQSQSSAREWSSADGRSTCGHIGLPNLEAGAKGHFLTAVKATPEQQFAMHPAPPSAPGKLPKPCPQAEPRLFACPQPHSGGASDAQPAHFRVSHLGRSDHSVPQRADRVNFSEGTAGGMPAAPERNLGGGACLLTWRSDI